MQGVEAANETAQARLEAAIEEAEEAALEAALEEEALEEGMAAEGNACGHTPVHGTEVHADQDGGYSYLDAGADKVAVSLEDLLMLGFLYTPPGMGNGALPVPGHGAHSHAHG